MDGNSKAVPEPRSRWPRGTWPRKIPDRSGEPRVGVTDRRSYAQWMAVERNSKAVRSTSDPGAILIGAPATSAGPEEPDRGHGAGLDISSGKIPDRPSQEISGVG